MTTSLTPRFGLIWMACALLAGAAARARADEIWVAPTYQQDFGGLGVASNVLWPVTPFGVTRLAWPIPGNLETLQSAKVAIIPGATAGGPPALHFFICAAANGDAVVSAGNCFGPFSQVFNTAVGLFAMQLNATADNNTAVGSNALINNGTGNNNVAVGASAGVHFPVGSGNIYLGANVSGAASESNAMYLGKVGTLTKTVIGGVRGITTVNANAIPVLIDSAGQLGTVSSSIRFKEDVHDMADASQRLLQLRPVTFDYTQPFADGAKPLQYGLIAEEVADVFPELAVRDANGIVETVHYETLNVLLLNELKKEHGEVEQQKHRIEALEERLNDLLGSDGRKR
jgi:hypothetical protein